MDSIYLSIINKSAGTCGSFSWKRGTMNSPAPSASPSSGCQPRNCNSPSDFNKQNIPFSMYCCSSEWIQFWGVTRKSCGFLQSRTKTHPKLLRAHSRGCDHHWDIGFILVQEKRTSSMLISSSVQVPPAAGALVPLTLCKKPKDYSKLQVPRVWKTANQTQTLVL